MRVERATDEKPYHRGNIFPIGNLLGNILLKQRKKNHSSTWAQEVC